MQRGRRDADICFHRPHAFVQLTAVAVLVASLLPSTWATPRPLTQGPTGLGQFANYTSALEVPSVKSAWIVERVVDCENPFVWLTFRAGAPRRGGQPGEREGSCAALLAVTVLLATPSSDAPLWCFASVSRQGRSRRSCTSARVCPTQRGWRACACRPRCLAPACPNAPRPGASRVSFSGETERRLWCCHRFRRESRGAATPWRVADAADWLPPHRLPPPSPAPDNHTVPVPKSKRSTPLGALDLPPPADVTSCTFVRNKFVGAQSLPYKGRCVFTEPFPTETRSYLVLDTNVTLAAKGTYHLVAHLTQPSSGRFWISVSDWSTGADYLSTYDAPVGAAPDGEDFFRKRPPAPACCVPDADCSAPLSVYAR